jgi:membrane protease YdiL (CAAX protease family)
MQEYLDYLRAIFFFGLLGFFLLWIAKSRGYFRVLRTPGKDSHPVQFKTVAVVFAIYLAMTMLLAPLLFKIIHAILPQSSVTTALGWLQLCLMGTIFLLFYLYCNAATPGMFQRIWKDRSIPHPASIATDFFMGILSWIISFPIVIAIGQLADMLLYFFFGIENYEQVAVRYLKTTLGSPSMLTVALLTILIAAPVIEEFLFRGCLQNFFKRYTSPKNAIAFSALLFSLFHFSPSQGMGNVSLIVSLFVFALFLGFIYERQSSLFASVGLHMTFNAVSTFRILFLPE